MSRPARARLPLIRLLTLFLLLPLLSLPPLAPAGVAAEEPAPRSFLLTARAKREAVPVRASADRASEKLGEITPDAGVPVLGEEGAFLRVLLDGRPGFAPRSGLTVSPEPADPALPEALCEGLKLKQAATARRDTRLEFLGGLSGPEPLDAALFFLWDERQYRVEWYRMLSPEQPAETLRLEDMPRLIPLKDLSGGRKTLVVEGVSGSEITVLFRSPVYVRGKSEPLPGLTPLCGGLPRSVLDEDVRTAWAPSAARPSLDFDVPEDAGAEILTLEWKTVPGRCAVETRDGEGNLLSRTELDQGFLADFLELEPGVRSISVAPADGKAELASVRVYAEPWPRHVIQRWEPVPEKLDILFISTHQDDEFLFFGGAIPAYAAREGVSAAVLYMVNCGRLRYAEALDALWSAGLKAHPLFLNLPDSYTRDIREARSLWNSRAPLEQLIRVFRKYRPEVVVVQDFRGEYGNGEHQLTAALAAEAVEKAALPEADPDSAAEHGAWQVKKLYAHLYRENQIRMDWDQPLGEDGVVTPMFLAREAFDRHRSQTALYSMDSDGRRFDNTLFGLVYSAVGPDTEKNDFLEHIPPAEPQP